MVNKAKAKAMPDKVPTEDPEFLAVMKHRSGQRTCLEKILILALALCLLAIIIMAILLTEPSKKAPDICLTKECAEIAARVATSIDYALDPCDDFYEFACGMWMKKHVVPDDMSIFLMHGVVQEETMVTIKYLLEDTRDNDIEAIRKARDHYVSCMNETQIEIVNISAIVDFMEDLGGMPMLGDAPGGRWNESEFHFMTDFIKTQVVIPSPLIEVYVGLDDKTSDRRILHISESVFANRGRAELSGKDFEQARDVYLDFAVKVAVGLGADPSVARQDLLDVYNLNTMINNVSMTAVEKRNRGLRYNKMTIADLEANFTSTRADVTDNLKFDWLTFLQGTLNIAGENITLDSTEEIILSSPKYFENLFQILEQHTPRTIKNYLVWFTITNMFNKLPYRFMDMVTNFKNTLTGTVKQQSRWKKCASETMTTFGMAVGRLFVEERFDEEAKDMALEMINYIREAFYERVEELDWMDPVTRASAKEKAKHIVEKIGYPDYILDDNELNELYATVSVDRDDYFVNSLNFVKHWRKKYLQHLRERYQKSSVRADVPPTKVNAYYTPQMNLISFPAGILQPPYYSKYQPRSMNYGSIGSLIGHEIIHGFDDMGRRYDKDGHLRQWWSDEAISKFTNKTRCFIDQYNSYKMEPLDLYIDGELTQGENIADNAGVVLSYKAYLKWLGHYNRKEPVLPGLNYTHDQLFFINYAQGCCGVATEHHTVKQILTDSHSPMRYRIIGSLQNSEDFSRVFQCPVGSYMNPVDKCHVW